MAFDLLDTISPLFALAHDITTCSTFLRGLSLALLTPDIRFVFFVYVLLTWPELFLEGGNYPSSNRMNCWLM